MLTTLTTIFSVAALLISLTAVYVFLRAKDAEFTRDIDLRDIHRPPVVFRDSGHRVTPKAECRDQKPPQIALLRTTRPSWLEEYIWPPDPHATPNAPSSPEDRP